MCESHGRGSWLAWPRSARKACSQRLAIGASSSWRGRQLRTGPGGCDQTLGSPSTGSGRLEKTARWGGRRGRRPPSPTHRGAWQERGRCSPCKPCPCTGRLGSSFWKNPSEERGFSTPLNHSPRSVDGNRRPGRLAETGLQFIKGIRIRGTFFSLIYVPLVTSVTPVVTASGVRYSNWTFPGIFEPAPSCGKLADLLRKTPGLAHPVSFCEFL